MDFNSQALTNVVINSGTVDGAAIGGSTPGAGTFTDVVVNDVLTVNAGAAITGDTTGEVTLAVTGVASQTVDLLRVSDSTGAAHLSNRKTHFFRVQVYQCKREK